MNILEFPKEILELILFKAIHSTSNKIVLTGESDEAIDHIEKYYECPAACRLVNKKFLNIVSPWFKKSFELHPFFEKSARELKMTKADTNSTLVGSYGENLYNWMALRRQRAVLSFVIDSIFSNDKDRLKAKSLFASMTYLTINPETYIVVRNKDQPDKIVILNSFRVMFSENQAFLGGSVSLPRSESEEALSFHEFMHKKRRLLKAEFGPDTNHSLGQIRPQKHRPTKFKICAQNFNNLAALLGCPEWSLQDKDHETQFLLPRFYLAIMGFPNLAMSIAPQQFQYMTKRLKLSGAFFYVYKPFLNEEVTQVEADTLERYPVIGKLKEIQESIAKQLDSGFKTFSETEQFFVQVKDHIDGLLFLAIEKQNVQEKSFELFQDKDALDDTFMGCGWQQAMGAVNGSVKNVFMKHIHSLRYYRIRTSFASARDTDISGNQLYGILANYKFSIILSPEKHLDFTVENARINDRGREARSFYVKGRGFASLDQALAQGSKTRLLLILSVKKVFRDPEPQRLIKQVEVYDEISQELQRNVAVFDDQKFDLELFLTVCSISMGLNQLHRGMFWFNSIENLFMAPPRERPPRTSEDENYSDSDSDSGSDTGSLVENSYSSGSGMSVESDSDEDYDNSYSD